VRNALIALILSFCLPPHVGGKIMIITFADGARAIQAPYRYYLTDAQNVISWERAIPGPSKARVASDSEGNC
jgi:hypothetical protein